MGIFGTGQHDFGKSFQEKGRLTNVRLRALRRGDKLGVEIASQKLQNLAGERRFAILGLRRSFGGQLTPSEGREFDRFRRANLSRLRASGGS